MSHKVALPKRKRHEEDSTAPDIDADSIDESTRSFLDAIGGLSSKKSSVKKARDESEPEVVVFQDPTTISRPPIDRTHKKYFMVSHDIDLTKSSACEVVESERCVQRQSLTGSPIHNRHRRVCHTLPALISNLL
jgi:hypothetical protein